MMNLINHLGIIKIGDAVAAGPSISNNSSVFTVAPAETVAIFTEILGSANTGKATVKVQGGNRSNGSDMKDLVDAEIELTATSNDALKGKIVRIEIVDPRSGYLRVHRASATANIQYAPLYALKYGARKLPISTAADAEAKILLRPDYKA